MVNCDVILPVYIVSLSYGDREKGYQRSKDDNNPRNMSQSSNAIHLVQLPLEMYEVKAAKRRAKLRVVI